MATTRSTRVELEPGTLGSGHTYLLDILTEAGFRDAGLGDLSHWTFPLGLANAFSHLVTVP